LTTAIESSNVEMVNRLKYTKEILTTMLTGGNKGKDAPLAEQGNSQIFFIFSNSF